jgi:hypothetical protein
MNEKHEVRTRNSGLIHNKRLTIGCSMGMRSRRAQSLRSHRMVLKAMNRVNIVQSKQTSSASARQQVIATVRLGVAGVIRE